jgi:Asp-tRNA(Asn)/Glu-tRNA(Gln) amidotransferase B subunit
MALRCQINQRSLFERKHYFYSDLPLGFQITQQTAPIASNGLLEILIPRGKSVKDFDTSSVRIARVQLEQVPSISSEKKSIKGTFIAIFHKNKSLYFRIQAKVYMIWLQIIQ